MKYKYINSDDKIWNKILKKLPKDNNNKEQEKLLLVNVVLHLLLEKDKYSLQMNWKQLENGGINKVLISEDNVQCNNINIHSLRKKFDRWRNNGVWEKILPIFSDYSKYKKITEDGTYEVLLVCSRFIRDKNRNRQQRIDIENEGHQNNIKDIKHFYDAQLDNLKKEIEAKDNEISNLNKKINGSIYNDKIHTLENENLKLKNIVNSTQYEMKQLSRISKFCVQKLDTYGYSPASSKGTSINLINYFREVLGSTTDEDEELD